MDGGAQQRAQLGQLMSDALQDPDLASQMAQLSDNLRALRPGLERGPVNMREGGESLGYSDAVEAVAEGCRVRECCPSPPT